MTVFLYSICRQAILYAYRIDSLIWKSRDTAWSHADTQGYSSPDIAFPGGALFGTWRCKRLSAPETESTTYLPRRIKMQVSKILVALTVAAGFASASFAQGTTPATPVTSAAPATKVAAPAPAAAEKKVEAPKAGEPAKVEAAKTEAAKADTGKPAEKQGKAAGHEKQEKHAKPEGKTEPKPETKAATAPAAAVK
jgi:hypothetical protein